MFEKDQRVTFTRSHDRVHSLTGKVVEAKDDQILVATDPAGVLVWANAADVACEEPQVMANVAPAPQSGEVIHVPTPAGDTNPEVEALKELGAEAAEERKEEQNSEPQSGSD